MGMSTHGGERRVCPTALQPPPHLLTTLPVPAGSGRCGSHGMAATAAGRAAARNPVPHAGDLGERPRTGGQSGRGRAAVERPKPAAAPATGLSTSSGPRERRRPTGRGRGTDSARRARRPLHPARKSCRPVPPIAGDAPSGGGHGSRLRGQPVSPPQRLTGRPLTRRVVLAMIKRQAAAAGLPALDLLPHVPGTGLTGYLSNGGT